MTSWPGRTSLTDPSGSTGCEGVAPSTRTNARSKSCETPSTRPGKVAPDARRTVTDTLGPTTCRLVMTVLGSAKNPLPRPCGVSIETIAGIELLTTSSREMVSAVPEREEAVDAIPGGVIHDSEKANGPGVVSWFAVPERSGDGCGSAVNGAAAAGGGVRCTGRV